MNLSGKTILVTRPKDNNAEIRRMLESLGASVVCLPTIEIVDPDSWDECDASIWKLAEYESVCFTSKNAVEKFVQRVRLLRPQALNTLATRNLYAVGEKTKSTLEATGFSVQVIPQKHSAEHLAQSFYGQNIQGKHFLFPKSNIAREILPSELRSLGAVVDEIVTYKTVIPESENLECVRALLADGKIDILTFFSPSSVRNLVELIGVELLQGRLIAVIGPTTAEAVQEAGLDAAVVAKQQTAAGMVQGIMEYYTQV
ncbi:MAG: uroporphyrinogen-III synthase [Ignavibacteriae bacterium]|nr:MAG: uroporphyrinogen-III synthase [Ignavibacteriota bacterium]